MRLSNVGSHLIAKYVFECSYYDPVTFMSYQLGSGFHNISTRHESDKLRMKNFCYICVVLISSQNIDTLTMNEIK